MKNLFIKFQLLIRKMPTINLVGIFIALGLFWIILVPVIFGKYSGKPLESVLIFLGFFFQGLAGLPIIIRKEISLGVLYLEGPIAIIIGILIFIIGISIATIPLWSLLLR
jgi:hypothetical protein